MNIDILSEKPMRGCIFENLAKIIIRRIQKHNYIFVTRQFDSLFQLIQRYEIKTNQTNETVLTYISQNFHKSDILEFVMDENKNIKEIIIYDVKTKYFSIKRNYFEFCKSNYDYLCILQEKYAVKTKVASIILFKQWSCDLQIYDFDKNRSRIYKYRPKVKK